MVTQEVDDIISSPVVKESIINNSDCKILLDVYKRQALALPAKSRHRQIIIVILVLMLLWILVVVILRSDEIGRAHV